MDAPRLIISKPEKLPRRLNLTRPPPARCRWAARLPLGIISTALPLAAAALAVIPGCLSQGQPWTPAHFINFENINTQQLVSLFIHSGTAELRRASV